MAYQIRISEAQRVALLDVLRKAGMGEVKKDHPLWLWTDILKNLPEAEAECPHATHGFCL